MVVVREASLRNVAFLYIQLINSLIIVIHLNVVGFLHYRFHSKVGN